MVVPGKGYNGTMLGKCVQCAREVCKTMCKKEYTSRHESWMGWRSSQEKGLNESLEWETPCRTGMARAWVR